MTAQDTSSPRPSGSCYPCRRSPEGAGSCGRRDSWQTRPRSADAAGGRGPGVTGGGLAAAPGGGNPEQLENLRDTGEPGQRLPRWKGRPRAKSGRPAPTGPTGRAMVTLGDRAASAASPPPPEASRGRAPSSGGLSAAGWGSVSSGAKQAHRTPPVCKGTHLAPEHWVPRGHNTGSFLPL